MRTDRWTKGLLAVSLAGLALAGGCSKKVTDPADLSTTVVEFPDKPNQEESEEIFRELELLKAHNEAYLNAPTARQREIATRNVRDIREAKARLNATSGGNG